MSNRMRARQLVAPFTCPYCRAVGCNMIQDENGNIGVLHPAPHCAEFERLEPAEEFLRAANDLFERERTN